jgi:hypothetical protein
MKALKILKYVGFGILGIGFVFLCIWLVMALWNCLIPGLFNGPVLTFWQTAGLFILSKILLTGISPHAHGGAYSRRKWKEKYHGKYGYCHPEEEVKPSTENA